MPEWVVCLRGLSFGALAVRLILAMLVGGLLGMERIRKHRPAGIRTYMLVCLGAAMTMILGQYQEQMMATVWKEAVLASGARLDPSRYSAQVISGIGFLGAGTVLVTGKQEVKGLTTAAGLWAAGCIGIGIGAGFYECAVRQRGSGGAAGVFVQCCASQAGIRYRGKCPEYEYYDRIRFFGTCKADSGVSQRLEFPDL